MYGKYVAYVGSYTKGKNRGITIYDVDNDKGHLKFKGSIKNANTSYLCINSRKKVLYAINDAGVSSFKILKDGMLEPLNSKGINGMRGCYMDIDSQGEFLYIAGYHDGKLTMIELNEDGSLGHIQDEIYFKGIGKPYEDCYRPHISCCRLTPKEKFICVADLSTSNYKVYEIDKITKKLNFTTIIPCEIKSRPREILFSTMGRFAYIVCTANKQIESFTYELIDNKPKFTSIQKMKLLGKGMSEDSAPYAISKNVDGTKILVSIVEDNSITFLNRDRETGMLEINFNLPISGEFPKDVQYFPNEKFVASCNHETNEITTFEVKQEEKSIVMKQRPVEVKTPNCIRFCRLDDEV